MFANNTLTTDFTVIIDENAWKNFSSSTSKNKIGETAVLNNALAPVNDDRKDEPKTNDKLTIEEILASNVSADDKILKLYSGEFLVTDKTKPNFHIIANLRESTPSAVLMIPTFTAKSIEAYLKSKEKTPEIQEKPTAIETVSEEANSNVEVPVIQSNEDKIPIESSIEPSNDTVVTNLISQVDNSTIETLERDKSTQTETVEYGEKVVEPHKIDITVQIMGNRFEEKEYSTFASEYFKGSVLKSMLKKRWKFTPFNRSVNRTFGEIPDSLQCHYRMKQEWRKNVETGLNNMYIVKNLSSLYEFINSNSYST